MRLLRRGMWALFSVAPTDSTAGTELTGGGYARGAVTNNTTNFPAVTAGNPVVTGADVTLFTSSGSHTAVAMGLFDAVTAGNLVAYSTFTLNTDRQPRCGADRCRPAPEFRWIEVNDTWRISTGAVCAGGVAYEAAINYVDCAASIAITSSVPCAVAVTSAGEVEIAAQIAVASSVACAISITGAEFGDVSISASIAMVSALTAASRQCSHIP